MCAWLEYLGSCIPVRSLLADLDQDEILELLEQERTADLDVIADVTIKGIVTEYSRPGGGGSVNKPFDLTNPRASSTKVTVATSLEHLRQRHSRLSENDSK